MFVWPLRFVSIFVCALTVYADLAVCHCVGIAGGAVSKGFTMTDYAGPTPPRGTHRYIFLLYEQVGPEI